MTGLIKEAIDELGGGVVVKLNWSSPKARRAIWNGAGAATTMRARTRAQPVMRPLGAVIGGPSGRARECLQTCYSNMRRDTR